MSSPGQGPQLSVVQGEDDGTGAGDRPVLRVLHGHPTDTELAALTATLIALGGASGAAEPQQPVSFWADKSDQVRRGPAQTAPRPGPGAWRYSLRPR